MSGDPGQAMDDKTFNNLLNHYLKSRGFPQAAEHFKKSASMSDHIEDIVLSAHASLLHRVLNYNRNESTPKHYTRAYARLQSWIENSIDIYRYEMQKVMWPLLVHVFLDLIKKNFVHQAHTLMEANKRFFKRQHVKEIMKLQTITKAADIQTNNIAKLFLEKKTKITMSRFSHQMLFSYLEQSNLWLLIALINEHMQICAIERPPLTTKEIDKIPQPGKSEMEVESVNEKEYKFWGVLPAEAELHSTSLAQGYGGVHPAISAKPPAKGAAGAASALAPASLVAPPAIQAVSIPQPQATERERQRRIADLKNRADLGPGPPSSSTMPSVCLYTFLNSEDATSTCVSSDASMVACGFGSSVIRTWNLTNDNLDAKPHLKMKNRGQGDGVRNLEIADGNPGYCKLVGHHGPVFSTAFSHDGDFLLSASQDSTIRLWNTEMALGLACYKGHTRPVWDVSFSPVGYYFATASNDRTARLWCTHKPYPLRIFAGHRNDVECVRFHPNSNVIATGSQDETVRLWDLQTGDAARLFRGHKTSIRSLAMAPNGRLAASGGEDGTIFLWDLPEGKKIASLSGAHKGPILSLDFSDDGGMLASGSMDCTVALWDIKTHQGLAKPIKCFPTKSIPVSFLRFTPRNLLLASGVYRSTMAPVIPSQA